MPRFDNYAYYVDVHFPEPVAPNSAAGSIEVEPSSALLERTWASPEAGSGAAAVLRLRIAPQPVDAAVTVTVRERVRSPDGKVLQEPARFTVTFAEPTRVRLTLRGKAYLWTGLPLKRH